LFLQGNHANTKLYKAFWQNKPSFLPLNTPGLFHQNSKILRESEPVENTVVSPCKNEV
jgi:hypothetical protein